MEFYESLHLIVKQQNNVYETNINHTRHGLALPIGIACAI